MTGRLSFLLAACAALSIAQSVNLSALKSTDDDTRVAAYHTLRASQTFSQIRGDATVRNALIDLLTYEGSPTTVASGERDESFGEYLADLIAVVAAFRDSRSLPALLRYMDTGHLVANAIAGFGPTAATPVLGKLKDASPAMRGSAAIVLKKMASTGGIDAATKDQIRTALNQASSDTDKYVQRFVLEAKAAVEGSPTGVACTIPAAPNSSLVATGGQSNVAITGAANCTWTARSSVPWLQVFPLNGTGASSVQLTTFPNFSTRPRTAQVTIAGQTYTLTQPPIGGTPDERFVGMMYFNYFGRIGAPSEIAFHINEGLRKGMIRAELVNNFMNSAEFNNGGRLVAGLYVGILNRDAEYGGWLFQRNALATGFVKQADLVRNFMESAEYRQKFGTPSKEEFVRLLYRHVLLREASAAEVAFQATHGLGDGSADKRVALATAFLNSAEFRNGAGPRLTSFLLFSTLLQRDPSSPEHAGRMAEISGGTAMKSIVAGILNSGEFNSQLD